MKLIRLCIAGILSLIAVACEKDSGGFVFDQIYVYEDGNLIDAQDLVVELPAGGGSIEKEFVTYGITEVRGVRNVEGISAEFPATCGYNGYAAYVSIRQSSSR